MPRMSPWRMVVAALNAEGIDRVFGLPGNPIHLVDDLHRHSEIKNILVRHEHSGVSLAYAYARITGQPAVCYGNPGPGITNMATALLEATSGETARADARLGRLAESHPTLPGLWLTRARIALQEDRNADARDAALRGLESAEDDSRFILLLARAQLRLNEVDKAETRINALIERRPESPELRLVLARLYLEEAHPTPARRLLLPLIDSQPTPPLALIMLGSIAAQAMTAANRLIVPVPRVLSFPATIPDSPSRSIPPAPGARAGALYPSIRRSRML